MMEKKSYKLCKNDHFFAEFVIYKLEIVLEGVKKLNGLFSSFFCTITEFWMLLITGRKK